MIPILMLYTKTVRTKRITPNPEDVKEFAELSKEFAPPKPNTMITATVGKIMREDGYKGKCTLKTSGKQEIVMDLEEVSLKGHGVSLNPGDKIQIFYMGENQGSFAAGAQHRLWATLERKYKELESVPGVILERSGKRSGYIIGMLPWATRGFLPLSKANMQLIEVKGLDAVYMFRIIRMDAKTKHITVSMGEDAIEPPATA